MVLTNPRFKNCQKIYATDFFSFSENQIFRNVCLSVPNCSVVENIFDSFCIAQIWYDLSTLRMFTVVKCRGHTNFDLSKIYEGCFQLIYNLVQLRQCIYKFDFQRKREINRSSKFSLSI